jgi:threonine/homoserine/homoserine lactone efflux protein
MMLLAYAMGFFTAIPVGATQVEIAKRALNNQMRAALLVMSGSVLSDVMYGCIAFFGLAPFLQDERTVALFGLCGTVILWVLAYFTLRQSVRAHIVPLNTTLLKSGRWSLITGFSLAVTNPIMIFWWLVGAKIVRDLGLVRAFDLEISLLFLVCGGLGLATYLTSLAFVLQWAKKFVSEKFMHRIHFALGIVLVLLSVYFLVSSLKVLLS